MVYRWGSDAITLSLSCLSSSSDSHTFAHSQSSAVQHPLLEHAQPGCSPQPSHTTPGSPSVPSQYIRVYTFFLLSSSIIVSLCICLYVGIRLKRPNTPLCSVPVSVCPYPSVPDPCAQYGWDQHTWPHFPRPSEDIGFSPPQNHRIWTQTARYLPHSCSTSCTHIQDNYVGALSLPFLITPVL